MPIARCSLRCGSSNAFRPQHALRSLFFEQQQPLNLSNARRISTTHQKLPEEKQPVVETLPAGDKTPTHLSPLPSSEYVNTSSLKDSLQTLRRKNRETLLGSEHTSTDNSSPSGGQSKNDEVDDLFTERLLAINKATLPKSTKEPPPKSTKEPLPKSTDESQLKTTNKSKAQKITICKMEHKAAGQLEYTGMYVRPSMGEADPGQEYPWTKGIPDDVQGLARLNAEIWNFVEYIKPTPAEQAAFKAVTEGVQQCAKQYCPDYETEPFGSQVSGLALSTSDIDVRLYDKEHEFSLGAPKMKLRREINAHITRLGDDFRENPDYILVRTRQARYPLLSMLHRETGLDIQIVACNDTSRSSKLIKEYLVELPYLYANYTLIRSMFDIRGLADVYRGGLGSYSLIMMIMAAMRSQSKRAPRPQERGFIRAGAPLAATRLLGILHYYAELDTYKTAISLEHPFKVNKHDTLDVSAKQMAEFAVAPVGKPVSIDLKLVADLVQHLEGLNKLALIDHMQPYLLCLQDPADPLNDLGRKGYGWKHIQQTIKVLRGAINKAVDDVAKYRGKNSKAPVQSVIAKAVGPCFKAYEARRAIVEAYGQKILDKQRAEREKAERAADKKAVQAELMDV